MLDSTFALRENGTTLRTELAAGVTTFLTMAYIIFVQPALLSGPPAGMDFGAVTAATCLSAAGASLLMGLWARYPIALAPGMGVNAFFVYTMIPAAAAAGHPEPWRAALASVFLAGVLFLGLTFLGVRERLLDAISPSLKNAIAVGIGLFIAFIGLKNAGLVTAHPATLVRLAPDVWSADLAVFSGGLLVAAALHTRGVRGSILLGIVAAAVLALLIEEVRPEAIPGFQLADRVVAGPPSLAPTFLAMDLRAALGASLLPFVLVFLFMDLFDTMGTLVGVSEQAGLLRDGRLPRASRALGADAIGTLLGACLGTSTVTSYIESAAGVEQGGRTGLVAVTVSALFVLALLFTPLIAMVASYPPITAPALVLVGAMMLRNVQKIDWDDYSESIPAFLIALGIPLFFSIGDGMAAGFIAQPLIKLAAGRAREIHSWMLGLALALLAYLGLRPA